MSLRRRLIATAVTILLAAVAAVAFLTRDTWLPWIAPAEAEEQDAGTVVSVPAGEVRRAKLTPQAQQNLHLVAKQVALQSYWRTIEVPGMVVDRPGVSDRSVTTPIAGVVARIYAYPGDTVKPGDRLFAVRLISESLQTAQAELFKAAREIQITQELRKKLTESGADRDAPSRAIELENQLRRLTATAQASRQDLLARGLSSSHVDRAAKGEFVQEMEVLAPAAAADQPLVSAAVASLSDVPQELQYVGYEVHGLKVELGQQVQAGQTLSVLANHQSLYIEGRSFKREARLLEQAARNGWRVRVEFSEDDEAHWPAAEQSYPIGHFANSVDPASRTFAFYLPLTNQSRAYPRSGKTFLVWRFRPGQRVRLRVPVEEIKDVVVLPAAAVAREGAEAYVFRQNGDLFERRPAHVLYEDRLHVVLAADDGIKPGMYLAQGAAASLNRIVKAQNASGGLPPGAHFHADGSLHIPGQ